MDAHFRGEKIAASYCAKCGQMLLGVRRVTSSKLRKLSASQRRVERMYGGQLCHSCIRDLLKQAVRSS
jgi:large subunit ribosomal protein L34e